MQYFKQHDPQSPQKEHHVLRVFYSPQENNGEDFYFIKQDQHLLLYSGRYHTYPETSPFNAGKKELIADQIELPLPAIRWFINVVEQKFFKPPEEGGLPADKLSYKEPVVGENLHVLRTMSAGCDHPGYTITNASRRSYISSDDPQTVDFSDPWLFDNGLLYYLKQLADDYEQGRL